MSFPSCVDERERTRKKEKSKKKKCFKVQGVRFVDMKFFSWVGDVKKRWGGDVIKCRVYGWWVYGLLSFCVELEEEEEEKKEKTKKGNKVQGFMVCERERFSVTVMGYGKKKEKKKKKKKKPSESGEHTVVPIYLLLPLIGCNRPGWLGVKNNNKLFTCLPSTTICSSSTMTRKHRAAFVDVESHWKWNNHSVYPT